MLGKYQYLWFSIFALIAVFYYFSLGMGIFCAVQVLGTGHHITLSIIVLPTNTVHIRGAGHHVALSVVLISRIHAIHILRTADNIPSIILLFVLISACIAATVQLLAALDHVPTLLWSSVFNVPEVRIFLIDLLFRLLRLELLHRICCYLRGIQRLCELFSHLLLEASLILRKLLRNIFITTPRYTLSRPCFNFCRYWHSWSIRLILHLHSRSSSINLSMYIVF